MEHPVLVTIAIIISALLILVAGFGMYQYNKETREERKVLEEVAGPVNDQLSRLYSKRDELQHKLDDIQEQMSKADDKLCSAMILVSDIKSEMLTDIVPLMDQYGYTGILTISKEYQPGMNGCISWDDVDGLIDKGWELCIKECEPDALMFIKQKCNDRGYELPRVIYYPNGACGEEAEKTLASLGFDTVIEYAGFVRDFEEGKLWHIPAQGSNNSMSQSTIQNCVAASEPIVMVVGYEKSDEKYGNKNFSDMLKLLDNYEEKNEIAVTNLDGAKERYKKHLINVGDNAKELQDDYNEIKRQIDEVNKQIESIRQ